MYKLMKIYISIFLFVSSLTAFAQKDTSQLLESKGIEQINIDTDEVFKINLKTVSGDQIKIKTHAAGEYYNDISIDLEQKADVLNITSQFREILQSGFDKLSAHKVFALEISMEIPEGMQVYINSNIASVEAAGSYKYLQVQLNSGHCNLTSFIGNALINTFNGAINIETTDATVVANSRNGTLSLPPDFPGIYQIHATSINGNIRVVEN